MQLCCRPLTAIVLGWTGVADARVGNEPDLSNKPVIQTPAGVASRFGDLLKLLHGLYPYVSTLLCGWDFVKASNVRRLWQG
jgi:hypothetical protein